MIEVELNLEEMTDTKEKLYNPFANKISIEENFGHKVIYYTEEELAKRIGVMELW